MYNHKMWGEPEGVKWETLKAAQCTYILKHIESPLCLPVILLDFTSSSSTQKNDTVAQ